MDKFCIYGGKRLRGEVEISGSKNAALPIMAACLLSEQESILENMPNLEDVTTMIRLLGSLGCEVERTDGHVVIRPGRSLVPLAPYKLVKEMRASICVLGALMGRMREAEVSLPGGCVIGERPIDLHLKGLGALGAEIRIEHGYVKAKARELRGAMIHLSGAYGSSVLATANVMMAACVAKGVTVIEEAAREPEIVDLAHFLNQMGAKIDGTATHRIRIEGVERLQGTRYRVIPDRIEAGTYLLAAAATGGQVKVQKVIPEHHQALAEKLREAGSRVSQGEDWLAVSRFRALKPIQVVTHPYPGFPTDLQAQMMVLTTVTPGTSIISEKVFPKRFMHVAELNRMGSNIIVEGSRAIVTGVKRLSGAHVMASDLRASAALVIAGLVADGRTEVHRLYHLDRGYEQMEGKLSSLGARVWREKE